MLEQKASQIARAEMNSGRNCCQAVLVAAGQVWNMPVEDEILAAANLFGGGMGSGCTCGALAGMVMAAGIREQYCQHPRGGKLAQDLHDQFKEEFGATCCRVIRKKRSVLEKIGNQACAELTAKAAALLVRQWEGIDNGTETASVNYHTHAK
ncbi:MAG: C-GCAxxG-C-C family protein [Syntrophomonas sp.]|nr:C-GCAxxG-C-C family protein [Syntrophomonas sp.]